LSTRSVKREYLGSSARRFTKERRSKAAREEAAAHNASRALRPADRTSLDGAGFGAANRPDVAKSGHFRGSTSLYPTVRRAQSARLRGQPADRVPKYHRAKLTDHWVRSRLSLRGISRRVSGAVSNQCLSIGPIKTRWDWLGATGSASVADARHALRLTNPRS
jgi:hypothetical protein